MSSHLERPDHPPDDRVQEGSPSHAAPLRGDVCGDAPARACRLSALPPTL